jgi:hypothetical protein
MKVNLLALIAAGALFGVLPANATTYTYVGSPYTINQDPARLGTNMTGSATFNFDTSAASGIFFLSGGNITSLQLTSGLFTSSTASFDPTSEFVLLNGAIVQWNLAAGLSPVVGMLSESNTLASGLTLTLGSLV